MYLLISTGCARTLDPRARNMPPGLEIDAGDKIEKREPRSQCRRQMFNEILALIARLRVPPALHDEGCGQMRRPTVQGAARRTHSNKFQHHGGNRSFRGSVERPCGAQ